MTGAASAPLSFTTQMTSQSTSRSIRVAFAVLVLWPALVVRSAEPASAPSVANTDPPKTPQYPVPYAPPTAEQIKQVMDRVRDRLEAGTGSRIIDRGSKETATDLSNPGDFALDSGPERKFSFYSYPRGVVYSGMLLANEVTGDQKYADCVARRYQLFADNLPALSAWPKEEQKRNPFRSILAPGNLDACGAMGASMARAQRMKVGPDLHEVIDRFADYVSNKQFRLEDGTLARKNPFPQSLWLDDAYMSVPLLAQYGKLTGERKYFDDGAKQIKQFYAHLFVPSAGLYTHGGNMANPDNHPRYFWGRANGWQMVATVELLDLLPEDHSDRGALIKILRDHAQGIASAQSGTGLWHQLLDRPDSYLETSCTAMFTYSLAKGVNRGWLSASQYGPTAIAGWNGLTTKISPDGKLEGVCIGTNYADDFIYYYHRPAQDDVHGYGPVLLAGSEMIRLMKNDHVEVKSSPTSSTIITEKK
jgi:unsaturated rhamnogalacturonyl hydrolase